MTDDLNAQTTLTEPKPSDGDVAAAELAAKETADAKAAEEAAKVAYDAMTTEEKVAHDKEVTEKKEADDAKAAEAKKEADAKAADKKPADKKADKSEGAPKEYTDFTVPQGLELDKDALAAALPVFKELNLTQAQGQALVDLQSAQVQAMSEAQENQWDTTQTEWREASESDKEIGGEKHLEHVAFAKKALDRIGTKALRDLLDVTGVGNHVEAIRFFSRVGRLIGDDKLHFGNVSGGDVDAAKLIYDKSPELK